MKLEAFVVAITVVGCTFAEFDCPRRWTKSVVDEKCIQVFKFARSFEHARDWCKVFETRETRLADLVSIHSKAENDQIEAIARSVEGSPVFWTGMQLQGGSHQWTDGSPYDYNNFGKVPSSSETKCVIMDGSGRWSISADCEEKKIFACEMFPGKPLTTSTPSPATKPPSLPADCRGYLSEKSGVKKIQLPDERIVETYCSIGKNNAYTVIQSRGEEDTTLFNESYFRYQVGFGVPGKHTNFWLGLENMHRLIGETGKYALVVEICCNSNPGISTTYKNVKVLDEKHSFSLQATVDGGVGLAYYTGTTDLNSPFSTYGDFRATFDKDNCDVVANTGIGGTVSNGTGGWWFGSCANNLNGHYYETGSDFFIDKDKCTLDRSRLDRYGSGVEYRTHPDGWETTQDDGSVFEGISYTRVRMSVYELKYLAPQGIESLCD